MTTTVAVAGKGGTGKTTFAALLIKYLKDTTSGPILAIVIYGRSQADHQQCPHCDHYHQ